jgi:hypothetical protein
VAQNIFYPCETVDGAITELSGPELEKLIGQTIPVVNKKDEISYPIRCPTGEATIVPTIVGSHLGHFNSLLFAVAPFWPGSPSLVWERKLQSAYLNSLELLLLRRNEMLATPLLG